MKSESLFYTKTHEWVHVEAGAADRQIATVGLSKFALDLLTDLVFIDLPNVGDAVEAGDTFGEIESVKAVSSLYCPVSGEIVAVNDAVSDRLETLAQDPYDDGWFIKIKFSGNEGLDQLLDFASYQKFCESETH
ncbi:MAG: glycine cleavage system protein GcvH [Planctomycetaceae bacterium]|nr:glycine cleavage system protein GcvH [Planctomycetaceae bacterium]